MRVLEAPLMYDLSEDIEAMARKRRALEVERAIGMADLLTLAGAPPPDASPHLAGRKDDQEKDRLELIPPEAIFAEARILTFGARKYADRNWEAGMKWSHVYGATLRHLFAWWGGRGPTTKSFLFGDLDAETGFSHLWHARCCIGFLVAYEERGSGEDDRFKVASERGGDGGPA